MIWYTLLLLPYPSPAVRPIAQGSPCRRESPLPRASQKASQNPARVGIPLRISVGTLNDPQIAPKSTPGASQGALGSPAARLLLDAVSGPELLVRPPGTSKIVICSTAFKGV